MRIAEHLNITMFFMRTYFGKHESLVFTPQDHPRPSTCCTEHAPSEIQRLYNN